MIYRISVQQQFPDDDPFSSQPHFYWTDNLLEARNILTTLAEMVTQYGDREQGLEVAITAFDDEETEGEETKDE